MIHSFKYRVTLSFQTITEDVLCVAFVLGVNELMIKGTVLKLEDENINLKEFTILTVGPNQRDSFGKYILSNPHMPDPLLTLGR